MESGQLKTWQLDLRIVRLLVANFDAIADLDLLFIFAEQPAFDNHAFVQDHINIINRRLVFESRIARHADQSEGVHSLPSRRESEAGAEGTERCLVSELL